MTAKLTTRIVNSAAPRDTAYEVFDRDVKGFLLRVQPSGVKTYYFAYRNQNGNRRRYKIGAAGNITPAQARDVAKKLAADVVNGIDVQAVKEEKKKTAAVEKSRSLFSFLDNRYLPWAKTHRKTGQETVSRVKHNFSFLKDYSLSDISPWILEKWRSKQVKAGKAKTTINRDVAAIKSVLSKAVEWGVLDINPLAKVRPLKTDNNRSPRFLSLQEENRLREALRARDLALKTKRESANEWRHQRGKIPLPSLHKHSYSDHLSPMVLLSLNTGMRRGETFSLKWEHINFANRSITIDGNSSKNGKTRHIALNQESLEVLRAWKAQSQSSSLVFPGRDGNPLDNVKTAWNSLLDRAGLSYPVSDPRHFRWHDIRHSFASKLVMKGVALNTVRELLGHSDLTTTLRYAHLAPDHKAEAVEKLVI